MGTKGVKTLCFNFDMIDSCEIPSSLLSCLLGLTIVKFRSRTLDVPQLFRGFKLLRVLELDVATIAGADLERLVSRYPLLQYLKLVNVFESFGNLVIQSQSLEIIVVFANFKHLVLDTPKLFALDVVPDYSALYDKKFKKVRCSYRTYPDRPLDINKCCKFLMVKFLNFLSLS